MRPAVDDFRPGGGASTPAQTKTFRLCTTAKHELGSNPSINLSQLSFCERMCSEVSNEFDPVLRSRSTELAALKSRILRLQPGPRSTADVTRPDPLRDDAFEVHPARMTKDGGTVSSDRLAQLNAVAQRLVSTG